MQTIMSIADDLALSQASISNEDIVINVLNGLNEDFKPIAIALKAKKTPVTYEELYEKLSDFATSLNQSEAMSTSPVTINNIQRGRSTDNYQYRSGSSNQQYL